jgi:hypothetical protein
MTVDDDASAYAPMLRTFELTAIRSEPWMCVWLGPSPLLVVTGARR